MTTGPGGPLPHEHTSCMVSCLTAFSTSVISHALCDHVSHSHLLCRTEVSMNVGTRLTSFPALAPIFRQPPQRERERLRLNSTAGSSLAACREKSESGVDVSGFFSFEDSERTLRLQALYWSRLPSSLPSLVHRSASALPSPRGLGGHTLCWSHDHRLQSPCL